LEYLGEKEGDESAGGFKLWWARDVWGRRTIKTIADRFGNSLGQLQEQAQKHFLEVEKKPLRWRKAPSILPTIKI